jgi:hypothetical protein
METALTPKGPWIFVKGPWIFGCKITQNYPFEIRTCNYFLTSIILDRTIR